MVLVVIALICSEQYYYAKTPALSKLPQYQVQIVRPNEKTYYTPFSFYFHCLYKFH